jgi:integrase
VIPVTPHIPNHHTHATIQIADARHDHAGPIATRITLNTRIAKTSHSFAMRLQSAGAGGPSIALMLGHESPASTRPYLHADLELKQKALDRTAPPNTKTGRYTPPDKLLAFLESL